MQEQRWLTFLNGPICPMHQRLSTYLYLRLAALGPEKYMGRAAFNTEMYLRALSYRVIPRAGSPGPQGWQPLVQKST